MGPLTRFGPTKLQRRAGVCSWLIVALGLWAIGCSERVLSFSSKSSPDSTDGAQKGDGDSVDATAVGAAGAAQDEEQDADASDERGHSIANAKSP